MTTDELFAELKRRGHYPLLTITADEVIEYLALEDKYITDAMARNVCAHMQAHWAGNDDFNYALQWASELVEEGAL